jgi:hypothetical protein
MARKPVRRLTQAETIMLHEVLKQHVKVLPKTNPEDRPLCEFEAGWDDERCAKEVSAELTAVHAANLRINIFGNLFVRGANEDRIERLEEQVNGLIAKLEELTAKHDKLCTALSVNCIHDARYLRIVQS